MGMTSDDHVTQDVFDCLQPDDLFTHIIKLMLGKCTGLLAVGTII
jgi:hypothetical protein